MLDFQKQFNAVTGALSLFDMSYFVSGAAMFLSLLLVFTDTISKFIDKDHLIFSCIGCIVAIYIFGILCWITGKNLRYFFMFVTTRKRNVVAIAFEKEFATNYEALGLSENTRISHIVNGANGKSVAYSYMWAMLDRSEKSDCRERFIYASRFWVLRAIYEGLIVPVVFLTTCFYANSYNCCDVLSFDISNTMFYPLPFIVYVALVYAFIYLLSNEAKTCANTQIREILVAYKRFESEMK